MVVMGFTFQESLGKEGGSPTIENQYWQVSGTKTKNPISSKDVSNSECELVQNKQC